MKLIPGYDNLICLYVYLSAHKTIFFFVPQHLFVSDDRIYIKKNTNKLKFFFIFFYIHIYNQIDINPKKGLPMLQIKGLLLIFIRNLKKNYHNTLKQIIRMV